MYALVTGASSGIGYNMAIALSKRGYTVFGCAPEQFVKDMDPLRRYDVIPFALDITKPDQIEKAVAFFKETTGGEKLDLLYNNAGVAFGGPGMYFEDQEAVDFIAVNITGHMLMTKHFAPFLVNAKGTVVFTSSVAAIIPLAWTSLYCASKAAINAYARGIRPEFEALGVRVISVITGGVNTNISKVPGEKAMAQFRDELYGDPKWRVDGLEESMVSAIGMTEDGMDPSVYAERIADRLVSGFSGFNIYEGKEAGAAKFMADWIPLWLQYAIIGRRFKQNKVFQNIRNGQAKI